MNKFTDKRDEWLAEDILRALGPRRLILHGRHSSEFVGRMETHYNTERQRMLFILDRCISDTLSASPPDELIRTRLKRARDRMAEMTFEQGSLEIKDHNNGETYVKSSSNVRGRDIDFIHLFGEPDKGLVELLLTGDMLRRAGATGVDLYLPFIPYQREDKKDEGRVSLSAKQVFNLINSAYAPILRRIVTIDLHAAQEQGFIDVPLDHLHFLNLFCEYVLSGRFRKSHPGTYVVAALDPGGVKKANRLAKLLNTGYVVMDKERTGHGESSVINRDISDRVEGKHVLGIEDMIDTGGSVVSSYQNIMSYGALSVTIGACHGVLSPKDGTTAEEKLRVCEKLSVVIGGTVPKPAGYYRENSSWLTVLSVTKKLAQVLVANRMNFSVSSLIGRDQQYIKEVLNGEAQPPVIDSLLLA